jgi:hypothetical protein
MPFGFFIQLDGNNACLSQQALYVDVRVGREQFQDEAEWRGNALVAGEAVQQQGVVTQPLDLDAEWTFNLRWGQVIVLRPARRTGPAPDAAYE